MFNKWKNLFWPQWADQSSAVGSQEWNPGMDPGVQQLPAPPLICCPNHCPSFSIPTEFEKLEFQPRKKDLHVLNSLP